MSYEKLLEQNRQWADRVKQEQPDFFEQLADIQNPDYLWIGCSDSRVPANQIVDLKPGTIFVHRNIANVVVHSDLNCMSVMQFAVEVLKVRHIIVCGHYGCGGVKAALGDQDLGLIDNWLRHIKDVHYRFQDEIDAIEDPVERADRLCEKNVMAQVENVCNSSIVQRAWNQQQPLAVHGWVYGLKDGVVRDLNVSVSSQEQINSCYTLRD